MKTENGGLDPSFKSGFDSVDKLLRLEATGGRITHAADTISTLSNGLSYYIVEITCKNGTQYAIQAYGEEATQLFIESHRLKMNPPLMTIPPKVQKR